MARSAGSSIPISVVRDQVLQPRDHVFYRLLTVLGVAAIAVFFVTWFQLPAWGEHAFVMAVCSGLLAVLFLNNLGRWLILPSMQRPRPLLPRPDWKVAVVTTHVPGVEPLALLERTLKALVALDYPHDTWVLDEGDDEEVKQVCAARGVHHFSRKSFPRYQAEVGMFRKATKHGNYNAWLHEIGFDRYEILTAFDPDHVPDPVYLAKVLGYFDDARVGYVQAPQVYGNQEESFIARGAAEETYEFYSLVQMACFGKGFPLIIGCHSTHRLSALRECGGFAAHDADDLLLTLLYQNRGWEGVYVPEVLARGLAPSDWPTYLNQQRRWTRAVLDLKLRVAPVVVQNLSPASAVLNVLHGINYVHRGVVLPIAVLLAALILILGQAPDIATVETIVSAGCMIAVLRIWERYRQRFYLNRTLEQGTHWRARLLQFAKWPYQVAAIADVLANRQVPYITTPKTTASMQVSFALWPHVITLGILSAAWGLGLVLHETLPFGVQLCAMGIAVLTVGLMLTEWRGTVKRRVSR
ncbi:MAG: glycosyltransferase [Nitrospira sp.]|nr:glycosyltransferase [Nitrospira sp.]